MTTPEVLASAQEAIQDATQQLTKLLAEVPPGPVKEELLALNPFELGNFSRNKTRYMAAFDVETWSSALEELSFPTAVAEVSGRRRIFIWKVGCG